MSTYYRIGSAIGGGGGGGGGGSVNAVTASLPLSSTGGSNPNISIRLATAAQSGALSAADWNTFNNKQNALTLGDITAAGVDGLNVTGGTGAIIGAGVSLAQAQSSATQNGYLSSADWTTFNNKLDPSSIVKNPNTFAGFDNAGDLESIPGFQIDTFSGGMFESINLQPNNEIGGFNTNFFGVDFRPLQNSPDQSWNIQAINVRFDVDNSGFTQGTNGEAATLLNMYAENVNSGSIGSIAMIKNYLQLGNGTDPISIRGLGFSFGFGDINSNVTIDGSVQGYNFQPHIHPGVLTTNNYNLYAFADFSNIEISVPGHASFIASPNITGIDNNHNYIAFQISPNLGTLTGNAGFQAIDVGGSVAAGSTTGYYSGLNYHPQITAGHNNMQGVNITPSFIGGDLNFTGVNIAPNSSGGTLSPNVRGVQINLNGIPTSDPNGPISIETDSRLSVNGSTQLTSGLGFQIGSRIEHLFSVPAGSPVTGTDELGLNLAGDLLAEDDIANGGFGIGFNAAGIISSMGVALGKTVDSVTVVLAAPTFPTMSFTDGGTITNMHVHRIFPPLPQGGTAIVTNLYGFKLDSAFGPFSGAATNTWGLFIDDSNLGNYIAGNLAIDTVTTKVTNSSVGLEIGSTTKALRLSNLTTTERNALTAVSGMEIFNTTTAQVEYYDGVSWVGPSGGGSTTNVEYHTVTAPEAAAKQFTMANTPIIAANTLCDIITGGPQAFTLDFTIVGSLFDWNGLGLDGILDTGDIVRLNYLS